MTKNEKRVIIVDAIVLIMFLVIALAAPFVKNGVFWLSLLFGVLAIVVQLFVLRRAFEKGADCRSHFYGIPIIKIGIGYMAIQIGLSLIFMIISSVTEKAFDKAFPIWIVVILYILLLCASAIGLIEAEVVREEVVRIDRKVVVDTECIVNLRAVVASFAALVEGAEEKKILEELSDAFRYSDPVSKPATEALENELEDLVAELQGAISSQDNDCIKELSKKISLTLAERNRICKLKK